MNILGEMKTLLELQIVQGMNASSTRNSMSQSVSDFSKILNQTMQLDSSTPANNSNILNTLGALNQMTTSFLPNRLSNQVNPNINPVQTTKKEDHSEHTLESIIEKAANTFALPAKLIKSVIKHESNFDSSVISPAGATGLMQLMPATAKGLGVQNIKDPLENVMGGSKYLRQMLDKYDGDLSLALAAYNAGPGNVDKFDGIPPFKETQNYVKNITNSYYS